MEQNNIIEKLKRLHLNGMIESYVSSEEANLISSMTPMELLTMLVDAEWDYKENNRIVRAIKAAKFRCLAKMDAISYHHKRGFDKDTMRRLADCSFIKNSKNILVTGKTGCGKSYITSAIGHQACYLGYKVGYYNMQKLMPMLKMKMADGSYTREIRKLAKQDLIILDDFALSPFDETERMILLEIMEDRYGVKSTIVSSQLPIRIWYDMIGEGTLADAILDRIVKVAEKIELTGESMRGKELDIEV